MNYLEASGCGGRRATNSPGCHSRSGPTWSHSPTSELTLLCHRHAQVFLPSAWRVQCRLRLNFDGRRCILRSAATAQPNPIRPTDTASVI